ncbi:MAG: GNAT family N-acetyltransferase [Ruminococcus sp.]|nr:GNAT family N-acetyltransferase [Ruminococcus sp.]
MTANDFEPIEYQKEYEPLLLSFLESCLPESHRCLDINGRHSYYLNIAEHFAGFWCMFDGGNIIGTVAVSELESTSCELKSLYLSEKYQGMGYGKALLEYAIEQAKKWGYKKMFLDSLSTSSKAIALYRRYSFRECERYNSNVYSDVFMVLEL